MSTQPWRSSALALTVVASLIALMLVQAVPAHAVMMDRCAPTTLKQGRAAVEAGSTMVALSSLLAINAPVFDSIVIHDASGQVLDPGLCRVIPPTGVQETGKVVGPVFVIDRTPQFSISLTGAAIQVPESLALTVVRQAETRGLRIAEVTPALNGRVGVGSMAGELTFTADPVSASTVIHTRETNKASYRLEATESTAAVPEVVNMRSYSTQSRSVMREVGDVGSVWSVQLVSRNARGKSGFHAARVAVVAGDQLVVVYGTWAGKSGEPTLWIDRKSDGTLDRKIALHRGMSL